MTYSSYLVFQVCICGNICIIIKRKNTDCFIMVMCLLKTSPCLQPLKFPVSSCQNSFSRCRRSFSFNVPCSLRLVPKNTTRWLSYYTKYFISFIGKANLQHFMRKKFIKNFSFEKYMTIFRRIIKQQASRNTLNKEVDLLSLSSRILF